MTRHLCLMAIVVVVAMSAPVHLQAQLQFTELLVDSVGTPEGDWEWFEVRNSGSVAVDLNGFVLDDDDGNALTSANISNETQDTVLPAGSVAVIYNGTALGFTPARFRNAWQLPESVRLIGARSPPGLANTGDHVGLWPNFEAYQGDVGDADGDGDNEVVGVSAAATSLDFTEFPRGASGSIYWDLQGNYQDGANWRASVAGEGGATTSALSFQDEQQLNDPRDLANPGVVPGGSAPPGVWITEVMFDPASPEASSQWEWVEIWNNTNATIDFAQTPFVLDDDDDNPLAAANVASGQLAPGKVAILINGDDLETTHAAQAWGADLNFIGVTRWSSLSNSGDAVGLWSGLDAYQTDSSGDTRSFDNAASSVAYGGTEDNPWPKGNNRSSIYWSDFAADSASGSSWAQSTTGDEISFNASAVLDRLLDHPGGDVGSPGFVSGVAGPVGDLDASGALDVLDLNLLCTAVADGVSVAGSDLNADGVSDQLDVQLFLTLVSRLPGDTDLNGDVQFADFVSLANHFSLSGRWSDGDFDCDGLVQFSDFVTLAQNFGQVAGAVSQAVPEPNLSLLSLAFMWAIRLRPACRRR